MLESTAASLRRTEVDLRAGALGIHQQPEYTVGVTLDEMNNLEMSFCKLCNFELFVSREELVDFEHRSGLKAWEHQQLVSGSRAADNNNKELQVYPQSDTIAASSTTTKCAGGLGPAGKHTKLIIVE